MTTLQTRPATAVSAWPAHARPVHARQSRIGYHTEILLVSFAALLIEICYTRVVSYKLFYYYTYLIIGLALLGIGSGAVMVALSKRLRRARTDTIVLWSFLLGAVGVVASYVGVAYITLDSLSIWRYGVTGAKSMGQLFAICLLIFLPFVAPGVIIATLFGRRPEGVGGLYFADLVGAGLACSVVIWLTASIGPPAAIMLAAAIMFLGAAFVAWRSRRHRVAAPLPVRGVGRGARGRARPVAVATARHHQVEHHDGKGDLLRMEPDLPCRRHPGVTRRPGPLPRRDHRVRDLPLERPGLIARPLRLQRRSPVHPLQRQLDPSPARGHHRRRGRARGPGFVVVRRARTSTRSS